MRAPENEATATAGQSEVVAAFEKLGWGPVPNAYHDLGTDLWIAARDERRFDLGLLVGAQVKSGSTWFDEPVLDEDEQLVGWWFRESDRRHFDSWLRHAIPHLVVLYHPDDDVAYWVHVTNDEVQSTGQGAKILVPKANILDAAHRQDLITVAGSGQAGIPWEGSIWMAGAAIPAGDHLRHALMVPRLIAPHPNAGREQALSPEQATAMLMQARLFEYHRFAEQFPSVPRFAEAQESADWNWKLLGALFDRVTTSALDQLLARAADAPDPARRAAATVAAASALIETGDPDTAIGLLTDAIDRDDSDPIDHRWLLIQRGRARSEIGDLEAAHADAIGAQAARALAPNDATAAAISAAAAVLLFNTAGFGQGDLREVITGADTAAGWWRAQVTSRGLGASLDRWFAIWANDRSVTVGGEDTAQNQLFAAGLTASHTGDHAGWRRLAAEQATDQLVRLSRHADVDKAAALLGDLRLAGDYKSLQLATWRLSANGPARAVTLAATDLELTRSTRTTGFSDLKFVRAGGDLLDPVSANRTVAALIATLDDPAAFIRRTGPTYILEAEIVDTLAAVVGAADGHAQRAAAEAVLDLPTQSSQITATSWARLVDALPVTAWPEDAAKRLAADPDRHHFPLPNYLLAAAAALGDDQARTQLIDKATGGSLEALAGLGDVREMDAALVDVQIRSLSDSVRNVVSDARKGTHGMGLDCCDTLALLNLWHPDIARWDPVVELLGDDAVAVGSKRATLGRLAAKVEQIPAEARDGLARAALRMARQEGAVTHMPFDEARDASAEATLLAMALGAFDAEETALHITRLLSGEPEGRRWAAILAGRNDSPTNRGLLIALAGDDDPEVRAAAAGGLATSGARDPDPLIAAALRRCAADPGKSVGIQLAFALQELEVSADDAPRLIAAELRAELEQHPSATVRRLLADDD
jgi:hypothetical protein